MVGFFKKFHFKALALFVSFFLILNTGFSNNDPLNKEDQQKLNEAKELNQSAQKQLDQADELFSEIAILQADGKGNSKKTDNLNKKALDHQLKAYELQKQANILKYQVYSKQINWLKSQANANSSNTVKANLLIEQSEKLFYQAEMLRMDAYALNEDKLEERSNNLMEAQEFERLGLEKQYEAYLIFSGQSSDQNLTSLVTKPGEDKIIINEKLLNEYLKYLAKTSEPTTIEILRDVAFSDSVSSVKLRQQWDNYVYNYSETTAQVEGDDSIVKQPKDKDLASAKVNKPLPDVSEINEGESEDQSEKESIDDAVFMVQIAADKKPVSQGTLQKIYSSNKDVDVIEKDGWFSYSIGKFESFDDADEFRSRLGNNNAFVVKINEESMSEADKKLTPKKAKEESMDNIKRGLIFKIQIAASRNKLSKQRLALIYNGEEKVEEIFEDGWYKYSIGKYSEYVQAKANKQQVNVKDAFIVSYHNETKVPLYLAIKRILPQKKATSESHNIVFKVQIAADTEPLSSSKLHAIYSGHHQIESYTEDGWYKYSIGELETFDDANQLRVNSNVKGAFIVAFKNGKIINVLDAKKMVKNCYTPKIISDWKNENDQIIFRVQIAASKNELTPLQLKQKYCGEKNVYLSIEDPWYKYAIGNFLRYKDANQLKNNICVAGAFVVAYYKGEKIDVKKAINKSK